MRNRYYSAGLGRFLSDDPIGVWGDWRNFGSSITYCANSPMDGGDPYGMQGSRRMERQYDPSPFYTGKDGRPDKSKYDEKSQKWEDRSHERDPGRDKVNPEDRDRYDEIMRELQELESEWWSNEYELDCANCDLDEFVFGPAGQVFWGMNETGEVGSSPAAGGKLEDLRGISAYGPPPGLGTDKKALWDALVAWLMGEAGVPPHWKEMHELLHKKWSELRDKVKTHKNRRSAIQRRQAVLRRELHELLERKQK